MWSVNVVFIYPELDFEGACDTSLLLFSIVVCCRVIQSKYFDMCEILRKFSCTAFLSLINFTSSWSFYFIFIQKATINNRLIKKYWNLMGKFSHFWHTHAILFICHSLNFIDLTYSRVCESGKWRKMNSDIINCINKLIRMLLFAFILKVFYFAK